MTRNYQEMIRNHEALFILRDTLVADKKHHDQAYWARVKLKGQFPKNASRIEVDCATAACAAGHACLLAGDVFLIEPDDYVEDQNGKGFYHATAVRDLAGAYHDISDRAGDLLGLTHAERDLLFDEGNSHRETLKFLDQLIAGEDIV